MTDPELSLAEGMTSLGIDFSSLWSRYLTLGGSRDITEVQHHVEAPDCPDDHEHNLIAQALNDAFIDRGGDHPVAYRHLYRRPE